MIKELTAQEVELVSGGDDWAIGAFTAGSGAALAGTLTLVPGPHVPVAAAIGATFGLMTYGFGYGSDEFRRSWRSDVLW